MNNSNSIQRKIFYEPNSQVFPVTKIYTIYTSFFGRRLTEKILRSKQLAVVKKDDGLLKSRSLKLSEICSFNVRTFSKEGETGLRLAMQGFRH
jgi:hypothetical protein